jgi:hypothetical protein
MKKLLAEMRHYNGALVTSGDVYLTIIKVTDIDNPVTVLSRTTTGVTHVGSGVWAYINPYPDPGNEIYIAVFDFTESPSGWTTDFTYTVTGAIGGDEDTVGNWSIIAAAGTKVGEIRKPGSSHIDIELNNGRKLTLRKR